MTFLKLSSTIFFVILSITLVSAQKTAPTPPEESDDIVKISTNLIQVDVTVTNSKGEQIRNLNPEDFEILENDQSQKITNFSYISVTPNADSNMIISNSKTSRVSLPIVPVKLQPNQVRRTIALVVDDQVMSFGSMFAAKDALKKFVDEQMQPSDLVAIVRTSGGIGALQQFTSDKRILYAAIKKLRWLPNRTFTGIFAPMNPTLQDLTNGTIGRKNADNNKDDKDFEAYLNDFRENTFSVGTLGGISYVVKGMKELPGRKAVVLLSDGFRLFDRTIKGRTIDASLLKQALDGLTENANRAGVVINTIDTRGVVNTRLIEASENTNGQIGNIDKIQDNRMLELLDSQDGLILLANKTGGISVRNNNGIVDGVKQSVNDQNGYYLIGYQPDSETFDPEKRKFNKLTVRLKKPDLKVRYRSGFFGVTDEKYEPIQSTQSNLIAALTSPFGTNGIDINLYSAFYNNERNENIIRSFVYINPKDLNFTLGSDGLYRANFDIIATVFDSNGNAASNDINSHTLQFTKERFAVIQEKGIVYDLPVPISKTGAYQFRVALQDSTNKKIGAASQFIEIPDLKKKQLSLSNLIVRNYTLDEWKKVSLNANAPSKSNTTLIDTVTRQFKKGSILTYFFEIYNAKTSPSKIPQLLLQTRLFRDGKMLLESSLATININDENNLQRIGNLKLITLGTDLQAGDYALQIIVFDQQAKEKKQIATQSIDFEITE